MLNRDKFRVLPRIWLNLVPRKQLAFLCVGVAADE